VDYDTMSSFPVSDPVLARRLSRASARFFSALGGASFGRCDLRVDRDGKPWMLEINPNCGVFYPPSDPGSADICLAMDPAGHEGFVRLLVRAALKRHRDRQVANRRDNVVHLPALSPLAPARHVLDDDVARAGDPLR
jgi:D-alanine-D-alanine ligase